MTTKVKLIADGAITPDQITLTTASAGTNTVAPATTAFVQQEITALVDSSPAALNTLNELAAALGDDANFSTTVTNSIALKAPLASPDFTGDATFDTSTLVVDGTNNRVGIGTASPQKALVVTADNTAPVRFERNTSDGQVIQIYKDSSAVSSIGTNFIAIGTSTPSAGLLTLSGVDGGSTAGIYFNNTTATTGKSYRLNSGNTGEFMLYDITSSAYRIYVNTSGNVGIGTASPTQKLDVNGTVELDNLTIAGSQGSDGQLLTSTGSGIAWEDAPAGGPTFKAFGTSSIMIGDDATGTINAADYNTGLGVDVFAALTEGDKNVAVGYGAAKDLTTGVQNTAVGEQALTGVTTTNNNTAIGYRAMTVAGATECTAIGTQALNACSGDANTAVGWQSLVNNGSGSNNTAVGYWALKSTTTSGYNVAVGAYAGFNITTAAGYGTYLGYNAGKSHTGGRSVFVGEHAGFDATTTDDSVFIGRLAGENVTTGYTNIIIGDRAGASSLTTGYSNVMIGYKAGQSAGGFANTFVGSTAGQSSTGSYNTCIGNGANFASANNGGILIGQGAAPGAAGTYATLAYGGSKSWISLGATGWSGSSDKRLKENIRPSEAGLSFINDLKPVNFDWRKRKDIDSELSTHKSDSDERYEQDNPTGKIGFIAQDVRAALDNHPEVISHLWEEQEDGTQALTPNELIPILVKAVQELSAKVEELQND